MKFDCNRFAETFKSLFANDLNMIGKEVNFIQRTRTLTLSSFVCTTLMALMKTRNCPDNNLSFSYLSEEFKEQNINISAQGLHSRFDNKAVELFRKLLNAAIAKFTGSTYQSELPLLKSFNGVYLGDCTTISLPPELQGDFPGCGFGKKDSKSAELKIYCNMEVASGNIVDLLLADGKTSDHKIATEASDRPSRSLIIHDLGFYNVKQFRKIEEEGSFFISRVAAGKVLCVNGQKYSIGNFLLKYGSKQETIDMPIEIGETRYPVRCVAFHAPPEVAAIRRKKMREKHRSDKNRRGNKQVSEEQLITSEWTIFITNLSDKEYSQEEIYTLYRVRWQIELLFKLWKSEGGLCDKKCTKGTVCLSFIYATLLGILILYKILLHVGGPLDGKSYPKMMRRLREHINVIAKYVYCADFKRVAIELEKILNILCLMTGQQKRNKHPSTRQTLSNAQLPWCRTKNKHK